MAYDSLLGAGNSPRAIPILRKYSIDNTTASSATSWTNNTATTDTLLISDPSARIFAFQVTIRPRNSNGTTGSATNPTFEVQIEGNTVAKYSLLPTCSDSQEWTVTEMVPYNYEVYNDARVNIIKNNQGVGGNGYQCNWTVTVYGVLT